MKVNIEKQYLHDLEKLGIEFICLDKYEDPEFCKCWVFEFPQLNLYAIVHDEGNQYMQVIKTMKESPIKEE